MRYFIGFLITLGLIIIVIFLLFRGGGDGGKPKTLITPKALDSYASSDAEVSMTIDGPVNADSLHQQLRVTVDHNNVTFEQLKGYEGTVVSMRRYDNTETAYSTFLISLKHAGFTLGDTNPKLRDERGYCSLGDRYIFKLDQGSKQLERYWTSSCGKTKTYLGAFSLTRQLFETQVPDYDKLTEKLNF